MEFINNMGKKIKKMVVSTFILILLIFSLFPIFWLFLTSLKKRTDVFEVSLFFKPNLNAYLNIFTIHKDTILQGLINSVLVATISVVIVMVLAIMSGYSLSRIDFKERKIILFSILGTRLMPPVIAILPLFIFFKNLGLIDTIPGIAIIHTCFNLPLAIWLMKSFFDTVPSAMEESAMIDGATRFQATIRIVFPLIAPGIAATSMLTFLSSWNEFVFALLFSTRNARTAPIVLANITHGEYQIFWSDMAALGIVMILPAIFLTFLAQKNLVKGLTVGAIK